MLVHCDKAWDVLGVQAWNANDVDCIKTLAAMKAHAEKYYEGLAESWREVPIDAPRDRQQT